jgi:hypothetical protein
MRRTLTILALLATSGCSASSAASADPTAVDPARSLVTLPEATAPTVPAGVTVADVVTTTTPAGSLRHPPAGASFVVVDADGRIVVIDSDGTATPVRDDGWQRTLSLDGTYAVSTTLSDGGDTTVAWDALPSTEAVGDAMFVDEQLEVAATQVAGHLVAMVDPAGPVAAGTIAGGRASTTVVIASPERGELARYELDGNLVPEALGTEHRADGLPAMVFMLEYLPAEAPTRYRVRVLDTVTGVLSLPANLRDKLGPRVDQEMAGVTRGQVLSGAHGLLFTLYRGTSDMPDGHPYAFVHTLGLYDGVWCLDIPAEMELDRVPGSLATHGDRLYVASANGTVGAYSIDDLLNPTGPVEMLWVERAVVAGGSAAPAIAADEDGVVMAWPGVSGFTSVGPDGTVDALIVGPADVEAIALHDRIRVAIADSWWDLPGERPAWIGPVTRLVAIP